MPARWTVYLSRESDTHPLETVTRDLSSEGFYCYVPEPVLPGELLDCALMIPSHSKTEDLLCLKGQVQVVRLESIGHGYGIGCQLRNYSIVPLNTQQATMPIATPVPYPVPS
jgi:hypothetical protein